MSKAQQTGMRGVYLVAAELAGRGFIVSPTSRSALGADLLVTDQKCARSYSVQVKTNAKRSTWWLVGKRAADLKSKSLIYVLVNLSASGQHDYHVVPSAILAKLIKKFERPNSTFYGVRRDHVQRYKDYWKIFERA